MKRAVGTFREEKARQGVSAQEFAIYHDRVLPSPEGDMGALSLPLLFGLLGGGTGGVDFIAGLLGALERDLTSAHRIARASALADPAAPIDWGQIIAPMVTRCRVAIELRSREHRIVPSVAPAPVEKPSARKPSAKRATVAR